jgi:hypothetical protein
MALSQAASNEIHARLMQRRPSNPLRLDLAAKMTYITHTDHIVAIRQAILNAGLPNGVTIKSVS